MRERHASKESSAEPDAIRSIFLPDIVGWLLEALGPDGAAGAELTEALDEVMDGLDEDFISSLAQPAVRRAINAITPAILVIPGLMGHSSVSRNGQGVKSPYCNLLEVCEQQEARRPRSAGGPDV